MASCHAGQDSARESGFPGHRLARGDHRQAARRGDAQAVHSLADDVFPEHGPQCGAPVTAAGERSPARTLELDVEAFALRRDVFAQQNRPAVPEHGEVAELVPGVGLGNGQRAPGGEVAGKHDCARFAVQGVGVQSQPLGQRQVEDGHPRVAHRDRVDAEKQRFWQAGVAVVEVPARVGGFEGGSGRHSFAFSSGCRKPGQRSKPCAGAIMIPPGGKSNPPCQRTLGGVSGRILNRPAGRSRIGPCTATRTALARCFSKAGPAGRVKDRAGNRQGRTS